MNSRDIEQLNGLLRDELAAVETYTRALRSADEDAIAARLERCRASHLHRAQTLHRKIADLGGAPAQGSGAQGALGRLAGAAARLVGLGAALGALELGERRSTHGYRRAARSLSGPLKDFIENLLPEQQSTHRDLGELRRAAG